MSGFKAIRGVSSTLKSLLSDEMERTPVHVTLLPPDVTPTVATEDRINLYLYMVTENGNLKNQEIPGQGHPGTYGQPPLSLNLHYLMTAYSASDTSDDRDLVAQELLADGMRVFHDFPIIPPDYVHLDPELKNQFERIKIVLQPASLEEFAKIWTALPAANFRCSVAYNVTVVQIESKRPRRLALPVQTRRLHMSLVNRPQIASVYRTPAPGGLIGDVRVAVGQSLTITGTGFRASKTWVRLGNVDPIAVTLQPNGDIQLAVPDDPLLQPGPQLVQVLVERPGEGVQGGLDRGTAFAETVVQSDQSVFMLVPSITGISPGAGTSATTLTVNGTRLFNAALKSFVYVGDVAIPVDPALAQTPTSVKVSLALLAKADPPLKPSPPSYPVRIQVNGALSVDPQPFIYS
jgi:hypothetical protein